MSSSSGGILLYSSVLQSSSFILQSFILDNVEVIFPESHVVGSGNPSSVADNTVLASASSASAAADSAALVDKAIAKLPADVRAHATDSKRKAKSQDPGWKFGWWPDPTKKDFIRCIFCLKVVPSGIKRFKQHLAGGFSDTTKCSMVPEVVSKDINAAATAQDIREEDDNSPAEDEQEQETARQTNDDEDEGGQESGGRGAAGDEFQLDEDLL
ncbi:hypothetical protein ZEAMMB73_Zm00001d040145 [Zea mays]|uniref:BED-type domain-containing protein n=1 Tax=Zea mays TaxID=4577 RepID=A0A1D6MNE1_MAIZE|nr:hypothetical protein ZEAMMB73_Zm00001d040145 [Zea mays]